MIIKIDINIKDTYEMGDLTIRETPIKEFQHMQILRSTVVTGPPGNLDISSIPSDAEIYIDGILQTGTFTRALITGIISGTHTYRLVLTGYSDAIGTFDILPNSTNTLNIIMALPTLGNVCIKSDPPNASIIIDNIPQTGKITILPTDNCIIESTITNLIPGTHTYKLILVGYQDIMGTFDITEGQTIIVDAGILQSPSSGGVMIFGLVGIAALGMMMTAKPNIPK